MKEGEPISEAVLAAQRFRRERKWSRVEFARRYLLNPQTIAQWESGRRQPEVAASNYLRLIVAMPKLVEDVVNADLGSLRRSA